MTANLRSNLPVLVAEVDHRVRTDAGRPLGHRGYIQRLTPSQLEWAEETRAWAAWARLVVAGVEQGTPERFDVYPTKEEALAHAKYAASVAPQPRKES